jgi:hypothetical protein
MRRKGHTPTCLTSTERGKRQQITMPESALDKRYSPRVTDEGLRYEILECLKYRYNRKHYTSWDDMDGRIT